MGNTETNKDRIFKTAVSLFSTKGFRGTSIRDIANEMHISLSNIYHYFGNKEGLLLAILEHSSKRLVDELKAVSEMDLSPVEKLRRLVETHIRLAGSYTDETKIFFLDEEHLSEEGEEINRGIQRQIYEFYLKVLKELSDSGLIRTRSIKILAFNIFGVINWQLRWYQSDGPLSLEEVKEEMVAFIVNGVFGEKGGQQYGKEGS
ncbi:MAG: TetR family transcriptional regulator [Pseudomonadota bacterium]